MMNELNEMLTNSVSVMHINISGKHNKKDIQIMLDSETGVSHDDCVFVTKLAKNVIEMSDYFKDDYRLEVSSPGINRPLFSEEDFMKYQGENVFIELKKNVDNQRRFKGSYEIENRSIFIIHKNGKTQISLDNIKKANLIREIKI